MEQILQGILDGLASASTDLHNVRETLISASDADLMARINSVPDASRQLTEIDALVSQLRLLINQTDEIFIDRLSEAL